MRIAVCDDEALFREALHAKILQDGFAHDYETDVEEYGSGRALLDAQEKGYSAEYIFWMFRWIRELTTAFGRHGSCAAGGNGD